MEEPNSPAPGRLVTPLLELPDVTVWHGDALDVLRELPDRHCDACVTSPPYLDARPEYPSPTLDEFEAIFWELARVVDGPMLVNVGRLWRNGLEQLWWTELLERADHVGWPLVDTLVWHKPNANPIQGAVLTSAHEYVFLLGDAAWFDPDAVRTPYAEGSVERLRRRWVSSVSVKGDGAERNGARRNERRGERRDANPDGARAKSVVSITTGREKGNPHPAPMPLELAEHLVRLSGGSMILDPFAGSGTTALAARRRGFEAVLVERDAGYCQLAAERLGQLSLLTEAS